MIQLMYKSVAQGDMPSGEIYKIVEKSARNNAANELTGFLLYSDGMFFQAIEGPESAITNLMQRLSRDPRHHSIEIVHQRQIAERDFAKWRMKRLSPLPDDPTDKTLHKQLADMPAPIKHAVARFLASKARSKTAG